MNIYNQQLDILLKNLVEVKSITENEIEAAIVLKEYFKRFGVEGEIDAFAPNRGNFMASHIQDPSERTLILCSHIDVVPEGDVKLWNSDPFIFTKRNNLWYGRGVCDAKGSVAAMAVAFLRIIKQKNFNGNLIFLAVSGEEKGSVGAKRFMESQSRFDGSVIIGEPTNSNVNISQKGRVEFTVDVLGQSGHPSRPESAKNAIMISAELLQRLNPYVNYVNSIMDPYAGEASLAATLINTIGNSSNTIPGKCRLVFDRRWIYTEEVDDVVNSFIKELKKISDVLGIRTDIQYKVGIPAAHTNKDSKIVNSALKACEMVNETTTRPSGFPASCDMYVFSEVGIDTIILGAGNLYENNAHGYNEFINPKELERTVNIYINTINNYFTIKQP